MAISHQVIVVGGGPAGLNAAKYAANAGADVGLIDGGVRLGGQYWRHTGNENFDQSMHYNFDQGSLLIDAVLANARVTIYTNTAIWSASIKDDYIILRTKGREFITQRLIIATGAYDRSLPFPGWDIPGVMTAGGAQALIKGSGVVAGKKIVVAGTGPFLLSVATGIGNHGGNVVGVIEASAKSAWLKQLFILIRNPLKIGEGVHYLLALRNKKIPIRFKQAVVAAHAGVDGSLESVTIANIDSDFHITSRYQLSCDVAAIGWGFTPDMSLAGALGLDLKVADDGTVVACVDENQRTSGAGGLVEIFAAGESTGIGGSGLSLLEGAIAGLSAAHSQKSRKDLKSMRKKAQRFARALTQVYPVRKGWDSWLTPETVICRCEEVDYQTFCYARDELGASDARGAKLFARCGMGMCQGRVCAQNVSDLLVSDDADRIRNVYRPIISPITLGELTQDGLL